MSQNAQEKSNPKHTPTSEQKKQELPVAGVSPNDPIGVEVKGTGPNSQEK